MITTQKDFFSAVAEKTDMTQKVVKEVYDAMVEVIVESANSADETKTILPNIGTLIVNIKESYVGKNPKTGEAINVPASRRSRIRIAPAFAKNFSDYAAAPAKKTAKASATKKAVKKKK